MLGVLVLAFRLCWECLPFLAVRLVAIGFYSRMRVCCGLPGQRIRPQQGSPLSQMMWREPAS
jgi:hypothetical protein